MEGYLVDVTPNDRVEDVDELGDPFDNAILRFYCEQREPEFEDNEVTVLCAPKGAHRVALRPDTYEPLPCPDCENAETEVVWDPKDWRCACGRKTRDDVISMQIQKADRNLDYIYSRPEEPEPNSSHGFQSDEYGFPTEEHGPRGCHRNGRALYPVLPEFADLDDEIGAAIALKDQLREATIRSVAHQAIADRAAERDQRLQDIQVVTGIEFLTEIDNPAVPLLGDIAYEGYNVTLTANFKVGKTTTAKNMVGALVTGGGFLERFPTDRPRRVAWLNYELTPSDQRALIRDLNLSSDALERLLVLNLRGTRLCLTTPTGREWLVEQLKHHQAEVLLIDTYGAAVAPSVESENDNAGIRRFLTTIDEIKALAGCPSSIMTCHTGRKIHDEGGEHARGATVVDDWADVRLVLTKDRQTGIRFLYSEGRSNYDLPQSPLEYDPRTRRLWLPAGAVGITRAQARILHAKNNATQIVTDRPGITSTDLRNAMDISNNQDTGDGIDKALDEGLIHKHKDGKFVRHYPGPSHADGTQCPSQTGQQSP